MWYLRLTSLLWEFCSLCQWRRLWSLVKRKYHISFISDAFSSYRVSFSLMMSMAMMGLGPGHLVRALFHFPLEIPLVVSVAQDLKW